MVPDADQKSSDGCRFCRRRHPPKQCPGWGKECRKCGKKKHFENKCRSDRSQSQDNNWKQNHDKSQSQHNKSQDNSKKFHEVDRDDGFDYWYGAEANPESRWDHFDNNYDSVCVVHNVDDIDIGQLQLKSIDPIISRNNTKCFYFDIDDCKIFWCSSKWFCTTRCKMKVNDYLEHGK